MKISFKNTLKWLSFAATAGIMLLPSLAFAQGSPFVLPEDDLSRRTFIEPLFGPLIGGGESPLTSLMASFNAALLIFGGILMAYTIIAGTMSTAHDGEMLGKKWSSMWLPIRTALGVGMVLPVVGGGWCVAQAIVVWLAMQGAALANTLWDSFIGEDMSSVGISATYTPPSNLTAVRDTYIAMLVNSACVAAYQKDKSASASDGDLFNNPDYSITAYPSGSARPSVGADTLKIEYAGNGFVGMVTDSRCGEIVIKEELEDGNLNSGNAASSELLKLSDIALPVAEARWVELHHASRVMAVLGQKIANLGEGANEDETLQEEVTRTFDELLARYSTNVGGVAKSTFEEKLDLQFVQQIKKDGWIMAGAFYMQISKTQDMVTRSVTNAPVTVTPDTASRVEDNGFFALNEVVATIRTAQTLANNSAGAGSVSAIGRETGSSVSGSQSGWATRMVNWFVTNDESGFFTGGRAETIDVNENPIIMAKGIGEKMTLASWAAFGSFAVFTGTGVGGLGSTIAPIFSTLFLALLIPGATLSTYLPMLPYILWLGVVLGWAILLIEAIIAAPLWAMVHLAPDGDGIVGRGGQGYMLVLSLVLRPPLMIIGLVAAFVLMKPIGFLVNSTFIGAFNIGVSPGVFSVTQAIAGSIIYAVLMVIIVQRVFSLIHVIPDRLLRWIGGGSGGELGQEAGALDQGTSNKMSAGLAVGANQIGNSMMSAASNAQRERIASNDRAGHAHAQAKMSQENAIESSAGNYEDKNQDATNGSAWANDKRDGLGNGDAGLEAVAATAHQKAGRAAEESAKQYASADTSPSGTAFKEGLSQAQSAENSGQAGAVKGFMDAQTAVAESKAANGEPLQPFQEKLLARGAHMNKAAEHQGFSESIRSAKQNAEQQKGMGQQFSAMAQTESGRARSSAGEAVRQASQSSHPDAQAFAQSVEAARNSGEKGATTAVVNNATQQAYEAQQNGTVQPFQQSLIERDQHQQNAENYQQQADRILAPQAPPDQMPPDPFAEPDDFDGAPPGGAR